MEYSYPQQTTSTGEGIAKGAVSGAAMGDLSGFTLTLEGQETDPAYFVTSTVITANESSSQIDPNA